MTVRHTNENEYVDYFTGRYSIYFMNHPDVPHFGYTKNTASGMASGWKQLGNVLEGYENGARIWRESTDIKPYPFIVDGGIDDYNVDFTKAHQLADVAFANALNAGQLVDPSLVPNLQPAPEENNFYSTQPITQPSTPANAPQRFVNVNHTLTADDEISVTANIENNTTSTKEYRVKLYSMNNILLDKEPDFFWKNIKAGQRETITLKSGFDASWDTNTMGEGYILELWEQKDGLVDTYKWTNEGGAEHDVAPPSATDLLYGTSPENEATNDPSSGGVQIPVSSGGGFDLGSFFGGGASMATLVAVGLGAYLLFSKK